MATTTTHLSTREKRVRTGVVSPSIQKKVVEEAQEHEEKLANMAVQNDIIFTAKSVFPFDLFPDEISIDRNKVILIQRFFFFSEEMRTVDINGILDVTVDTNPFFASMIVTGNQVGQKPIRIRFLQKSEAVKAQQIIQGLCIATKRRVDYTHISTNELMGFAEKLGSAV